MKTKNSNQPKLSQHRIAQLETLLRRLRQRAFDNDRAAAIIPKIKARLMPGWSQRNERNMSERMLRIWS